MRPSAGRVNIGTYDMGKLSDSEISRLRGTEIGVVLQGAARNLLPYASLHRNIWLAQRRARRAPGASSWTIRTASSTWSASAARAGPGSATCPRAPAAGRARGRHRGRPRPAAGRRADAASSTRTAATRWSRALETVNAERGTTIVVVTHDAEVGARLGRAVTIRDGRVGAEGRDGQDFAVVAGDGTVQLPPEVLGVYPPGTLFTVDHEDGEVTLRRRPVARDRPARLRPAP